MTDERSIDSIDVKILSLLEGNARIANAEIARRVGLTPPAIFERLKKLEQSGIIQGYTVKIDPAILKRELMAFISVALSEMRKSAEVADGLAAIEEVLEVHHVVGEACYLLKVRCRDTLGLGEVLEQVNNVPGVRATHTTIVLRTSKDAPNPPLTL